MSNDVGRSSVDLFYFYAIPSVALFVYPDDFSTSTRGLARTMANSIPTTALSSWFLHVVEILKN